MTAFRIRRQTAGLLGSALLLLGLFAWVVFRFGPLAPVPVTVAAVERRSVNPALFGIGNVEAHYTYKIGPTYPGRIRQLNVQVGDRVRSGEVLGEMDPIDLDDRARALDAALRRAEAATQESEARSVFAQSQLKRYERLAALHMVSDEVASAKRQEWQVADAALSAAREDLARARADRGAVQSQRGNLLLVAPVDGVVTVRSADPGTTIVAGQAVVEIIDPDSLWINVRFDQAGAAGLAAGLPAHIRLRSHAGQLLAGHVLRVEPMADTVTEETLAKLQIDAPLSDLPPVGELAEVTVDLPAVPAALVVPNAALQRHDNAAGVWALAADGLRFIEVKLGQADLDGHVQVHGALRPGEQVVVYSAQALTRNSRVRPVKQLAGALQ